MLKQTSSRRSVDSYESTGTNISRKIVVGGDTWPIRISRDFSAISAEFQYLFPKQRYNWIREVQLYLLFWKQKSNSGNNDGSWRAAVEWQSEGLFGHYTLKLTELLTPTNYKSHFVHYFYFEIPKMTFTKKRGPKIGSCRKGDPKVEFLLTIYNHIL